MPLDQSLLRSLLSYQQETGAFTWSRGPRAGLRAGSIDKTAGYEQIGIGGKLYRSHRLAWLYVHGAWPNNQIDHINGIRSDNRIANLRDVTAQANGQNRKGANKNNSRGLLGAYFSKDCGRHFSSITVDRRNKFLGYFGSAEEAHAEHIAKRRELLTANTL